MSKVELSLEEVKQIELDLLIQFDCVCRQQNFRYSLGGGTLLGAVRHKGFIPWDDDIDVMMPRPDYDRFVEYCSTNNCGFCLLTYENNDNYINPFAKIYMPNTIMYKKETLINQGVFIDIFPLDGLGNTLNEAKGRFRKTQFGREVLVACTWKHFVRSKTHSIVYEPIRLFFFGISRFANAKKILYKIDSVNRKIDFDKCKYAGCVCGSYRLNEIVPQIELNDYFKIEFEGYYFNAIRNYDNYLTRHYGDYMKLPPEDKRKSHHGFTAYRIQD